MREREGPTTIYIYYSYIECSDLVVHYDDDVGCRVSQEVLYSEVCVFLCETIASSIFVDIHNIPIK